MVSTPASESASALPSEVPPPSPLDTPAGNATETVLQDDSDTAGADAGSEPPVDDTLVYAHSGSDLFQVDPRTLVLSRLGNLTMRDPDGQLQYLNTVTDIAVDRNGRIVGVTFDSLLEIDPETAECTFIAPLPADLAFNGLSFLHLAEGTETLVATTLAGVIYRVDKATGSVDVLGELGGGMQSSGDIVSVAGYGTLITIRGEDTDQLARVDPTTGAATPIGPIGATHVWGLGFWQDRVFGFTDRGEFLLIDPTTGAGSEVARDSAAPFWGAGVTTAVPVRVVPK